MTEEKIYKLKDETLFSEQVIPKHISQCESYCYLLNTTSVNLFFDRKFTSSPHRCLPSPAWDATDLFE